MEGVAGVQQAVRQNAGEVLFQMILTDLIVPDTIVNIL